MAISIQCPHCQRAFKLNDNLAGKRVTCNKCRKPFPVPAASAAAAVPATAAAPPMDSETLALAVLSEETAAKKEDAPTAADAEPIVYKCQFCDHVNKFDARMAGKNAPCAECRRIVKVPLLIKEKAKDWRTVTAKPTLARQDTDQLEGAWGVGQAQAVSMEALKGADVGAEEEPEPRNWVKRVVIGLGALGVVGLIAVAVMWGLKRHQRGKLERAMETALAYADPKHDPKSKYPKIKPEPAGLVLMLGARHALNSNKPAEAKDLLLAARSRIKNTASPEECAALIEMACGLADLTGSLEEVTQGKRLDLVKTVQKDLSATFKTLAAVPGDDGRDMRAYAFRQLTRRLAARGHPRAAMIVANVAAPPAELSEMVAVIGLELLALGHRDLAEEMAKAASVSPSPDASSVIALWLAIGDPNAAADIQKLAAESAKKVAPPPPKEGTLTAVQRIGYAEGWARQGQWERARQLAGVSGGKIEDRLRARVALAGVAAETKPGDVADLEACAKMLEGEYRGTAAPPWLMMRLIDIGAKAGRADLAARFAAAIGDPGLRAWGQYEVLRVRLKGSEQVVPVDWAKEVGKPEHLAHGLAWAAVARHNARVGGGDGVFRDVEKNWERDELRPFGYAGVALAAVPD